MSTASPIPPNPLTDALPAALAGSGLELVGTCQQLAQFAPGMAQHSALLEDFAPDELGILGAALLHIRAQPGQNLITEGQPGDWMLLVLSGTVDVTKRVVRTAGTAPADSVQISRLAVVKAGAALGEMSMLDGELRYATCTAIETVEAGILTRTGIGQLIREHPAVGAKLLVKITQLLAQRLRNTSNQLVKVVADQKLRAPAHA